MFFSSGVRRDVNVVLLLGEEEALTEKDTAGAVARTEFEELGKTGKEGKDSKTLHEFSQQFFELTFLISGRDGRKERRYKERRYKER